MIRRSCRIYSNATTDIEFLFPFGWGELWGIADRTDFDLTQHQKTRAFPWIFRPGGTASIMSRTSSSRLSARTAWRSLSCAMPTTKRSSAGIRTARTTCVPCCACIRRSRRSRRPLPLSKKLSEKAMPVREMLAKQFSVDFDDAGSIGKRYRREDEIGTPYCITVDFETEQDGCVTVRDRDTMEQERIRIEDVADYLAKKIAF